MREKFRSYITRIFELGCSIADRNNSKVVDIGLADVVIRIHIPIDPRAEVLVRGLNHLRLVVPYSGPLAAEIIWLDSSIHELDADPPPFLEEDYTGFGYVAYTANERYQLADFFHKGMSVLHDKRNSVGILLTDSLDNLSIYVKGAPFINLIHWITRKQGWCMAHAASIGLKGKGVLLVGNSGSGKSTTALSALLSAKLDYLCDDRCIVRTDCNPEAVAIYNSVKVNQDVMERFPFLSSKIVDTDQLGKKGKGLAFLYPDFKNQMTGRLALRSILIPRVSDSKVPRIIPTNSANAFRFLAPSTFISLPGSSPIDLKRMADLVSALPCFFLQLSPDLKANIDTIYEHILTYSDGLE